MSGGLGWARLRAKGGPMGEIRKVLCCCNAGLGSSLIVHMNAEQVLKELGHPEVEVDHSTVSEINPDAADLFVIGSGLSDVAKDIPEEKKVILDNLLDKNELKTKLAEKFN
jgi:PTS system ascorbate-specific IIB component